METCVTFTWIKLCNNLLRLTGNPMYADQIEKSMYNALMASMKADGSQIAKYSPLEGMHHQGENQCGMHINCCNANGPRAFTLIPKMGIMSASNEIYFNLYSQSKATVQINPKNKVLFEQTTSYPETDVINITLQPEKAAVFTLALRIPEWSHQTKVLVNGTPVEGVNSGSYCKVSRSWKAGDQVTLQMDMTARLIVLNGYQALSRGPILLARDSRFNDGFVDEAALVQHTNHVVEVQPAKEKPADVWMAFTAPLVLGTDLEGEYLKPHPVHYCDFASAGNTWSPEVRYRVWIKQTLNVMKSQYHPY